MNAITRKLVKWLSSPQDHPDYEHLRKPYNELLYAVGMKHNGETRHQTALRYIREREDSTQGSQKTDDRKDQAHARHD